MVLGALLDLGLPEEHLRRELAKLSVSDYQIVVQRVDKKGINAVYVDVVVPPSRHHHRHLSDIVRLIDQADLPAGVKKKSHAIFRRLAEAEAKVHGTRPESVHFHEVGAVDSIVDIIGAAIGFEYLGIERIFASKLRVGSGTVKCAHGLMPVPAPATTELLKGVPYYQGEIAGELVTPTGAAILVGLGCEFGPMPDGFVSRGLGYGAGTWDLDIPNVLRLHIGEIEYGVQDGRDGAILVETNIDDCSPQMVAYAVDSLLAAGALDAWITPIVMKKGRAGVKLSALSPADEGIANKLAEILLRETSTIGVRFVPVSRQVAERQLIDVNLPWGPVRVKVAYRNGLAVNFGPEYEDCRKLAAQHGVPLKTIHYQAVAAAQKICGSDNGQQL